MASVCDEGQKNNIHCQTGPKADKADMNKIVKGLEIAHGGRGCANVSIWDGVNRNK